MQVGRLAGKQETARPSAHLEEPLHGREFFAQPLQPHVFHKVRQRDAVGLEGVRVFFFLGAPGVRCEV